MKPAEQGFLLLTSPLGDPARPVMTVAQFRVLSQCVRDSGIPEAERELGAEDLMALGYNRPSAQRILALLSETERLQWYVQRGIRRDCHPITRISPAYPLILRKRLSLDSPGSLWARGDVSLLETPAVALVGSRDLRPENLAFAREAGRQAALQGYTLVSGNARGADREAQESCLAHGGSVISVVADRLEEHPACERMLYLAEDGYDLDFTAQRALSRNRVIHSLGRETLVAQCDLRKGGTWDGTTRNLHRNWSPVFCFDDGSDGTRELVRRGATPVTQAQLSNIGALQPDILNFFDQ